MLTDEMKAGWFRCVSASADAPFTPGVIYEVQHYERGVPLVITDTDRRVSVPHPGCELVPHDPWAAHKPETPHD